ncbi:MAG: extracellular solute-binding protein [Selenomonadaceae bacterium]|nr:extracellular solute-binding protein [Selenomonadaceae bacterium]
MIRRSMNRLAAIAAVLVTALLLLPFMSSLYADRQQGANHVGKLTVLTTLPVEAVAPLAAEYGRITGVIPEFVPLDGPELQRRVRSRQGELVLADGETLRKIAVDGGFIPYVSEASDQVSESFHGPNDAYVGVWYDPMVLAVNSDYCKTLESLPLTWRELEALPPKARLAMTDFPAASASAELFVCLSRVYGENDTLDFFRRLHPRITQYAKYLSTPARMAGMGEADVVIVSGSEAVRYIEQGYPLRLIWPEDGTSFVMTGVGITETGRESSIAAAFADWLLTDEAMLVMRSHDLFYMPTNPTAIATKAFIGKGHVLFEQPEAPMETAERQRLLSRWVKEVRMK